MRQSELAVARAAALAALAIQRALGVSLDVRARRVALGRPLSAPFSPGSKSLAELRLWSIRCRHLDLLVWPLPPDRAYSGQDGQAGLMFWLRWKTLSGSCAALSACNRASLAGG